MTTYELTFTVTGQQITCQTYTEPAGDTQGYLKAKFLFDATWDGLKKLGVFSGTGRSAFSYTAELDQADSCLIPAEALVSENRILGVGVLGYGENGYRLTTVPCTVRQQRSCYRPGKTPAPPAPDVYANMLEAVREAAASAAEAEETARQMLANAAAGQYDGAPGLTPHIGANGNWYLGDADTGTPAQGEAGPQGPEGMPGLRGERGYSGLVPQVERAATASMTVAANTFTVISPLTGDLTLSLGAAVDGYDNEWDFTITQGATAYAVHLPAVCWGFGFAPAFSAGSTTVCRLYRVSGTLCGEWTTVAA